MWLAPLLVIFLKMNICIIILCNLNLYKIYFYWVLFIIRVTNTHWLLDAFVLEIFNTYGIIFFKVVCLSYFFNLHVLAISRYYISVLYLYSQYFNIFYLFQRFHQILLFLFKNFYNFWLQSLNLYNIYKTGLDDICLSSCKCYNTNKYILFAQYCLVLNCFEQV